MLIQRFLIYSTIFIVEAVRQLPLCIRDSLVGEVLILQHNALIHQERIRGSDIVS